MKNKNAKISQCNFLSNKTIQSIIFIIGDVTFYKYLLESINHTLLQMSTEMRNIQECSNLKILHRYIILTNTILKNNIVLQKFSLLIFFFLDQNAFKIFTRFTIPEKPSSLGMCVETLYWISG